MAATDDRENDRRSDLAVMDAQEFKQKQRLKRLLDAHNKVEDKANEAWDRFVAGEISHDAKNIMIQRAVKEAVRESYKLLIDHDRAKEEEYSEYWIGDEEAGPLGAIEQVSESDIGIGGLRDFLATKEFYQETIVEEVTSRNRAPSTEMRTEKRSVPEEISWAAFLRLKEFLDDEHDLEIAFEEMDDKLQDERPGEVSIPDGYDLSDLESLDDYEGVVDDRGVKGNGS